MPSFPLRLVAGLLLALGAASTQATTLTYTFIGDPAYAHQSNGSHAYDAATAITTYAPGYGSSDAGINGSISFSIDAGRYTDQEAATAGITANSSYLPALPWLSSSSLITGPNYSATLNNLDLFSSTLLANSTGFGGNNGYLEFEAARVEGGATYDAQGRQISYHQVENFNRLHLEGDVALGLVDGQELPTAVVLAGPNTGWLQQNVFEYIYRYTYDDAGNQSYTYEEDSRYAWMALAEVSITRRAATVPEPGSLPLFAVGLLGLAARRRSRHANSLDAARKPHSPR